MQIDGSRDRQMLDHEFVNGRMANSNGSVTSVFVVMHSPEKNGAPGLLEAANKALDLTGGKDTKLIALSWVRVHFHEYDYEYEYQYIFYSIMITLHSNNNVF